MRFGRVAARIAPGDITLSPPGQDTSYDLERPGLHWCAHLVPPAPRRGGRAAGAQVLLPLLRRPGPRHLDTVAAIRRAGAALDLARRDPRAADTARAVAGAALQECLLQLALPDPAGAAAGAGRAELAVARAAALLDERCEDPPPIPWLARTVGLDQGWLAKRFRRVHGMTMQAYARHRRLERARHWLAVTDLPVAEIAARVGMADLQRFNKSFRRLAGVSPRAWRAAQRPGLAPEQV
jgi:AraC-like DNA-binding protein